MKLERLLPILIFAVGLFVSCSETDSPVREFEPINIGRSWELASPKSVRVNGSQLNDAIENAGKIERMRSLLVIRNGKLISENYFSSTDQETLFDVRSVTKSVIGTLVMKALDKGELSSLDKEIILPEIYAPSEDHQRITFRHLLSMSSGVEWDEWTNTSYNDWVTSIDEIQHILDLPFVNEPGTTFTYNSGAVHILGKALEHEVGMTIPEYADQELFGPLGIDEVKWEQLATGVNGGAGIDLRARDLARIGQLYLQEGISGDDELLTSSSISDLTTPKHNFESVFGDVSKLSYGFLWWTVKLPFDAYMAWGYGGQYIIVVPELKMVVVTTTDWTLLSLEGGPQALELAVMNLVYSEILPAAN